MASLADVFKEIEKISGKKSIMEGVEVKDIERIPLQMTMLNRMLYGGIPKGRAIEFSGPEGSGKTTTALMVAAAYQQQDDRPVFFVDAEGTYDPRWGELLGVDNSKGRFIKWAPENVTAEEAFQAILKVAETNEAGLIILDSIPVLVPQQEDAKNMTEYQMGGISKPLTVFTRKLQKVLLTNDTVTFIGLNQVRDNMSPYGPPTTTTGGRGWRHTCSIRIEFKSENIDKNGNYVSENVENPAGVKIIASLKKNKTAPRNRKLAHYFIDYETGYDPVKDLISVGLLLNIITQRGAGFSYITDEGVTISGLGRAKFTEKLSEEVLNEIARKVNEYED